MISRRAFFTFLAGGAVLVGLPAAYLQRQIQFCDLRFAFRDCKLRGGEFILKYKGGPLTFDPLEGEIATVGWKTKINGEKYGEVIVLSDLSCTKEEAIGITKMLQRRLDVFRRGIALRLA